MLILDISLPYKEISVKGWFMNVADESILLTDFSRRLLKEISGCEVISENLLMSDVLGPIPPEKMGSGVMTVLAMKYAEEKYGIPDMSHCGDNLAPFIMEIAREKDLLITCDRLVPFLKGEYANDSIMIKNSGVVVNNLSDLADAMIGYVMHVEG